MGVGAGEALKRRIQNRNNLLLLTEGREGDFDW
jgi:hypothetical protein